MGGAEGREEKWEQVRRDLPSEGEMVLEWPSFSILRSRMWCSDADRITPLAAVLEAVHKDSRAEAVRAARRMPRQPRTCELNTKLRY